MNTGYFWKGILLFAGLFTYFSLFAQTEQDSEWPREIRNNGIRMICYQPQLESYEDNILEGRMALSVEMYNDEPIFGAAWFSASVTTDLDNRTVLLDDLEFTNTKFPDLPPDKLEQINEFILQEIGDLDMTMSLDRFLVSLEGLESRNRMEELFNNDSPVIYFRTSPAVLVLIDGEPILSESGFKDLQYVVNTPFFIARYSRNSKYYINGGKWWYKAEELTGEWENIKSPPGKVLEFNQSTEAGDDTAKDSAATGMDSPPQIIISTKPAELIISDGEPVFKVVEGTGILYMENTESDVLMHIASQKYYILLSGRWFTSSSMKSDKWTYILPEDLPDEFYKIPEDSPIADVRTSIPGTDEAREAVLENIIPQTAMVDLVNTTVTVTYDGDPKFEKITGTGVSYALNSDKTVLLIDGKYYCMDEAVWFTANRPEGPWEVSVEVPPEVNDIPPDSPVYNVKYVHVYHHTPEVVYVGYTPGYYGAYVFHGTVIYGTGFYYHPWYGRYYYPRPVTYGFGVHYNPYTGWGFSVGISYGWLRFSWHPYYYRYWGPCGYRYGYRHGYHRVHHHGYRQGHYIDKRAGYSAPYKKGRTTSASNNIYRRRETGVISTGAVSSGRTLDGKNTRPTQVPKVTNRSNNLYTDPGGNVYRRDNKGNWQQRSDGQWKKYDNRPVQGTDRKKPDAVPPRPSTSRPGTRPAPSYNPNRDYNNRNRGTQRSDTFKRNYGNSRR